MAQETEPKNAPAENSIDTETARRMDKIADAVKQFCSAGSTFSTGGCAALVYGAWCLAAKFFPGCKSDVCPLVLSFMLVYAYAFVIPEPRGAKNAGKRRITLHEAVFGFFNSITVFLTVVGFRAASVHLLADTP